MCHFVYFCINVTNALMFFFLFFEEKVKPSLCFFVVVKPTQLILVRVGVVCMWQRGDFMFCMRLQFKYTPNTRCSVKRLLASFMTEEKLFIDSFSVLAFDANMATPTCDITVLVCK